MESARLAIHQHRKGHRNGCLSEVGDVPIVGVAHVLKDHGRHIEPAFLLNGFFGKSALGEEQAHRYQQTHYPCQDLIFFVHCLFF